MEDYPQTLMEFEKRFSSEEACHQYLFQFRWPNGFRCPRCDHPKAWLTKRKLYHCAQCEYEASITTGTIFQDTSKPLSVWFRAIWHITNQKHGISALGLQRTLGLGSYRTAWSWLHKLRLAMVRSGRDQLSGSVEVDETYIGGPRTGKRGRGASGKTLVLIMAQKDGKGIGRIRLKRILDASADSLNSAVKESIQPGSAVCTDGWEGYNSLTKLGYVHNIIRKKSHMGDNLLPLANRIVSLLKRWLLGTHQGSFRSTHLDFYLDEFTFRFNRRTSKFRGKLFYRLIQQAVDFPPVLSKDILGGIAKKKPQHIGLT